MIVSVPITDKNRSGEFKQYNQDYTKYANTNKAGSQIVCPIYTVNFGGAQSYLVA